MSNKKRAKDWLNQAINDLRYAKEGIKTQFYSQVCFMSQQAAVKAIKSIAYHKEYDIKGHSIAKIAKAIGLNSEVEEAGKRLDIYYISSRYPDALPEGAPFEFFSLEQAKNAAIDAEIIIQKAKMELLHE
ncbi:MAG: HEPN domain-containing protein [Bacteriovoracaceae bacterium]|nr:HEPN domain-containing protein [Bacteriovoracaceae bacterium]